MTQKKPTTRRKPYKNMSVGELVKARKELASKMREIDAILGQAVEAVGATRMQQPQPQPTSPADPFKPRIGVPNAGFNGPTADMLNGAQVAVGTQAPILSPTARTAPDQSSGFTLFDAESHARQQAVAEEQYLVNNPGEALPPEADFNSTAITDEIASLTKEIKAGMDNVSDTSGDSEE